MIHKRGRKLKNIPVLSVLGGALRQNPMFKPKLIAMITEGRRTQDPTQLHKQ